MRGYESMVQKLRPLGVYRLEEGTVLDSELKAYAAGIDPLLAQLEEMEREGFIPTAESYGLSERERFIEREREELPVEERRRRLLGNELAGSADATAEGFRRYLADCGLVQFKVVEYPTRQRVAIYIDDRLTDGEKNLMKAKITRAAPAHLTVSVTFKDFSDS